MYGRKSNIPEVVTEGVVAYYLQCPVSRTDDKGIKLKLVNLTKAEKAQRLKEAKKAGQKVKKRKLPSASFDCYDLDDQKTVQVKSASVNPDLSPLTCVPPPIVGIKFTKLSAVVLLVFSVQVRAQSSCSSLVPNEITKGVLGTQSNPSKEACR